MAGSRNRLCLTCKQLPLVLSHNVKLELASELALGTVEAMKEKTYCPLCRLLSATYGNHDLRSYCEEKLQVTIKWDPSRGFYTDHDRVRLVFLHPTSGVPASVHWTGRSVKATVEPALLKKWLSLCEDAHRDGPCCPRVETLAALTDPSQSSWFRVIDVQSMKVVTGPRRCRYVALSYIWGAGKSWRENEKSKSWIANGLLTNPFYKDVVIPDILPQTVKDAVQLVTDIGERYLWIDLLCLDQQNPPAMKYGIQHMDLIFEGAVLTIVAAFGVDNNAGLPGLNPRTRSVTQLSEKVRPGVRMATASTLYTVLNDTKYMTRGWTYQELLLSRRCLIFLESGVFFRCHRSVWSEDTLFDEFPQEVNVHIGKSQDTFLDETDSHDGNNDNSTQAFASYVHIVNRFTHREFTDGNDAVDAMAGILRRVAINLGSGILEGLPTSCFDASLIFYHSLDRPVCRRPAFPSWSWAGWSGHTHGWLPEEDNLNVAEWKDRHALVTWFKGDPETGYVSRVWPESSEYTSEETAMKAPEEDSTHPTGHRPLESLGLKRPVTPRAATSLATNLGYSYHLLHFWTYLVTAPKLQLSNNGSASILDDTNAVCGALFLDDKGQDQQGGPFDFILLSTCEASCIGDGRLLVKANRPFFWALLVCRLGPVFERRGLGFLFQHKIDTLLPPGEAWREIVLA